MDVYEFIVSVQGLGFQDLKTVDEFCMVVAGLPNAQFQFVKVPTH